MNPHLVEIIARLKELQSARLGVKDAVARLVDAERAFDQLAPKPPFDRRI